MAYEDLSIDFNEYTKKEIKEEVERISKEFCNNEVPDIKTIKEESDISFRQMKYNSGSWKRVLSIYICDKDKIKRKINMVGEELDKKPTLKEIEENSIYHRHHIKQVFDSWNDALEYSGYERRLGGVGSGKNHPNWQGGSVQYYGDNWYDVREEVWKRDKQKCRVCSSVGGREKKRPDVHHITPRKYWFIEDEYEDMNSLNNLISLCKSCHHKLEGKFKGRNHEEFEKLAKDYLDIEETEEKKGHFRLLKRNSFKCLRPYKDIMSDSDKTETVSAESQELDELREEVERLREEMDFIIERNGLRDLIENE
jgi:5-methylcytosine-specific restriction endonuclease McrA